jgi:uncharacterized protein (TIGR02453 family)
MFRPAALTFLRQLKRNNRREWFQEHREEYEDEILQPMRQLVEELDVRFATFAPEIVGDPKRSIFRIYRDVRFSKDKSPYKTHIGGYVAIDGTGAGPSAAAALYLHLSAQEVFVAAGQYMMDPRQLARFREAVLDDRQGAALAAILRKLTRAGFSVGSHDMLQRVPRGLDPAHPRADFLRRKGLIVTFPDPSRGLLVGRRLVDWLVNHTKRVVPLVEWLASIAE